jgi:hypothetical protein
MRLWGGYGEAIGRLLLQQQPRRDLCHRSRAGGRPRALNCGSDPDAVKLLELALADAKEHLKELKRRRYSFGAMG